jgi:signal transduction histidine kinase
VLLEKDVLGDSENKHYLEMISKNTDRLYALVTDIVDSSRINLGKLKFNIDVYDVYKIFNDVKEDMSLTISKKGFISEFVIEDRLPNIKADFERTMQVLHNLISNSIKFTIKGMISLHVVREGEFIKFIVKDTGQGIPDENKSVLFSRFYQVDSELTRKVGGSGLGLSICKGLVQGMGGKIGFESESGKGSTFYFTLPIADIKNAKKI